MSYVTNCYLKHRTDDASQHMFEVFPDGTMGVYLDGYAIIPKEEFNMNHMEQINRVKACIKNFKIVYTLTPEMDKLCSDIEAILVSGK